MNKRMITKLKVVLVVQIFVFQFCYYAGHVEVTDEEKMKSQKGQIILGHFCQQIYISGIILWCLEDKTD